MTCDRLLLPSAVTATLLLSISCSNPSKPDTPALTPGVAVSLLQMNPKSKNWLDRVRKEDASCEYRVEIPDQSSHPTSIDVQNVIFCGGKPAPRALNATVSYVYDQAAGHWVVSRFAS